MPAESLNLKPTDTYRATDTQVLRRRFIGHTVFSQYTFLWSLSSTEKQGVALVIKRQKMDPRIPAVSRAAPRSHPRRLGRTRRELFPRLCA